MKVTAWLTAAALTLGQVAPAWGEDLDVYFRFKDGQEFAYAGVSQTTTKEDLVEMIQTDFPDVNRRGLDEVLVVARNDATPFKTPGQATMLEPMTPQMIKEKKESGITFGDVVATVVTIAILAYAYKKLSKGAGSSSSGGNCQYTWQLASDGSRCGGRAASVR